MAEGGEAGAGGQKAGTGAKPHLVPTWFEKTMVDRPCLCCWAWFFFAIVWVVLAQMMLLSEVISFDVNGVWDVRNSEIQTQFDAFTLARHEFGTNESGLSQFPERTQSMQSLHVVLVSIDGKQDLLSKENMEFLKEAEDKVMKVTGMTEHCQIAVGADSTWGPLVVDSVNTETDIITLSSGDLPPNGTDLIFRGSSAVLLDGGRYQMKREDAGFQLLISDVAKGPAVVDFTADEDIATGSIFHKAREACAPPTSLARQVFHTPAEQKEAVCSGFSFGFDEPASDSRTIPVLSQVCGCSESSVSYGNSSSCGVDCAGNFGETPACTSTRFVEAPTPSTTEDDVKAELAKLCPNAAGISVAEKQAYKGMRMNVLPTAWSCGSSGALGEERTYVRSVVSIGGPVQGFTRIAGSTVNDQLQKLVDWGTDSLLQDKTDIEAEMNAKREGEVKIIIMSNILLQPAYFTLMGTEAFNAMGSVLFVWMWVWCSTGSMLLASCCIFETIMSIPMAIAFWGICGQQHVGFLCVMMVFVILGIGADDVFVLFDAWKQSAQLGFEDDLKGRFAWAYRRAGGAMFVTTLTTVFCFVAAGFADVPTISGFGWVAALIVAWDYFLVMTFFASALVVYHKYFERKNACCGNRASGHMFCCPSTCIQIDQDKPYWKQPKLVVPTVLLLLLGIVFCFTPRAFFGALLICGAFIFPHATLSAQGDANTVRPIETFFVNRFHPLVKSHPAKFIAAMAVIVVGLGVAVVLGLRLPDENEKFLNEDHPIQQYLDSQGSFSTGGNILMSSMYVAFGINKAEALDRSGVDFQQPGSNWGQPVPEKPLGVVQYDEAAKQELFSAEGQAEVIDICDAARRDAEITKADNDCELIVWRGVSYPRLVPNKDALVASGVLTQFPKNESGASVYYVSSAADVSSVGSGFCSLGVYCFMYDVRDYLVHFCESSAQPNSWKGAVVANMGAAYEELCIDTAGNSLAGGEDEFPASDLNAVLTSEGYRLYVQSVARSQRRTNGMAYDDFARTYFTGVGLEQTGDSKTFKFAWIGFNATLPTGIVPHSEAVEAYDKFSAWVDGQLTVNTQGFLVCYMFSWMTTVKALLRNTIQSVSIALFFCWFVLVFTTRNVIAGTLALIAVACIVLGAGGMMVVSGWSLGIIESIACIVIIGVSVDYSVHIVHAYNVAVPEPGLTKPQERVAKAKMALGSIGISLVSGLMTSLGSTLFLWFCQINFFKKFGMFLFLTLVVSFLLAFLLLVPMLILLGPAQGQCDLPALPCMKTKKQEVQEDKPTVDVA